MLKADILKANEALKGLTDDQIKAIETLSKNDEETVVGQKVGEIHGQYDRDFEAATGLKKPQGVKTYEWLKSDILPKVKTATELETQLATLKTEKTDLETKLANNSGDDTLKQKLADTTSQVTQLQAQLADKDKTWGEKLTAAEQEKSQILIDSEFTRAQAGLTFKPETVISKAIRESYIKSAQQNILNEFTPDWVDDGAGGKKLVMRDKKTNEIARNPENGLNPFTPGELLSKRITDVLDTGKKQEGAGTGSTDKGQGGAGSTLDLSAAKNQVEADEIAKNYLMKQGVSRGTPAFDEQFGKIREENKVADLPLR